MILLFEFMQHNLCVSFRCFARVRQMLWSKSNLCDFIILIKGLVSCPVLSQSIPNLISSHSRVNDVPRQLVHVITHCAGKRTHSRKFKASESGLSSFSEKSKRFYLTSKKTSNIFNFINCLI